MQRVLRVLLGLTSLGIAAAAAADDGVSLERGRYLVQVGGCNDCHTPNYPETAGQVPESDWLTGVPVGYSGPWGTSYAANLRLTVQRLDEAQFIARARGPMLPPMPWFNLVAMSDTDIASLYRYIRSLGPAGELAPAAVPPGVTPTTPYFVFVPVIPGQEAAPAN